MEPEAARLREAAQDVVGEPGVELEPELGRRPAAEVDGRARERVVHRDDGVAEARDPAPVAERAVERLAERDGGVLGGVVLAGLEVAGRLEDEVEAGVEGELLQEVVVEAGARRDADAACAVEREADAHARLGGRPQVAHGRPPEPATGAGRSRARAIPPAGGRRPRDRGRSPDPVREDAHDEPRAEERRAQLLRLLHRHEDEVRPRRQRLQPESAQAAREALALLHLRETSGGSASAATASAAESVEIGAGDWRRLSSAAVSASASA